MVRLTQGFVRCGRVLLGPVCGSCNCYRVIGPLREGIPVSTRLLDMTGYGAAGPGRTSPVAVPVAHAHVCVCVVKASGASGQGRQGP